MTTFVSRRQFLLSLGAALSAAGCAGDEGTSRDTSTEPKDTSPTVGAPGVDTATQTATSRVPTTTPGTTRHGITFDRVLNAVDDLGFDDTGARPIDGRFADAYESGTLIEFPPGEYRVAAEHSGDVSRFGVRGTGASRRDVRIVPEPGATLKWLKAVNVGPHLVENLSLDERGDDTTQLSLWFRTTPGSVLRNVEWLGRTPDDSGIEYSLTAETGARDGVVTIDGLYAGLDEPAVPVTYPDGVAFVRTGRAHRGEVVLRNAAIHERNSTATRFEAGPGVVQMENCEFVNNQLCSIRVGGGDHPSKRTVVRDCYVAVDGSRDTTAAVQVEGEWRHSALFDGVVVEWENEGGRGVIASPAYQPHGPASFEGCVVRNEAAGTPTVSFATPQTGPSAVTIENSSFTGAGGDIVADGRPGSVIRECCIDMSNASVSGFSTESVARSGCRLPRPILAAGRFDSGE